MANTRKNRKGKKGTRKLSPKLSEWNKRVMAKYRELKAKNPSARLGDAMKALKGKGGDNYVRF
jgi:hypothetical protein